MIQKILSKIKRQFNFLQDLVLIKQQNNQIMEDLSKLKEAVEKQTAVIDSAVTLIQGLAEEVRSLPVGDQSAIDGLAQRLEDQSDRLAEAVAANTPADTSAGTGDATSAGAGDSPVAAADGTN